MKNEKATSYPKGRRCREDGCETILSRHNPRQRCAVHGGWTTNHLRDIGRKHEREAMMAYWLDIMEG